MLCVEKKEDKKLCSLLFSSFLSRDDRRNTAGMDTFRRKNTILMEDK
jgi:hypothetical protein